MATERSSTVQPSGQIVPIDRGLQTVRQMLGENAKGLEALLGRYLPMERFCGAVLTLCRHNPDLTDHTKASRPSLLLAVMRIAQLQLSPDPAMGQAWIIPRQGRAEFQIGWKGCLALAYRSPLVSAVRYNVVRKGEHFVWRDGKDFVLEHEPTEEGWPDRMQDIRAAWAIIETVRGGAIPRVMYAPEILRHKARGMGSQPAWGKDPAPMAVKTVLGDACRRGPFDAEVGRAFALDHLGEIGKGQGGDDALEAEFSVVPRENGGEKGKGAAAAFKAAHGEAPPPETEEEDRIMDAAEIKALYAEGAKLGIEQRDIFDALVQKYGEELEIPVRDRPGLVALIQTMAKGGKR